MFRRLPGTLPPDPVFPADLDRLGYFINDNDQIRQIKKPEQKYQVVVNKNDRFNDVYKEAMNKICRRVVEERLEQRHISKLRLPLGASETDPHVPIYFSRGIESKKQVLVVFGERNQDPTIFSYRVIGDEGIKKGSIVDFVDAVTNESSPCFGCDEAPGLIIANPSQLYWHRGGQRAVTYQEWLALPRASGVHEPFAFDPVKNIVPNNRDYTEHVICVFQQALPKLLHEDARLDIIALEWTGSAVLEYLQETWDQWSSKINGICFGGPQYKTGDFIDLPASLQHFLSTRCRAYVMSSEPQGSLLPGRQGTGSNRYSSGEELYQENVIVRGWPHMLQWFGSLTDLSYQEAQIQHPEDAAEDPLPN